MKKSIVFFKYGLKLNLAKGERFDVYEIKASEISLKKQKDFLGKLDLQYEDLSIQLTENQKLFQEIKADVSPEKSEELFDARVDARNIVNDQVYGKLY